MVSIIIWVWHKCNSLPLVPQNFFYLVYEISEIIVFFLYLFARFIANFIWIILQKLGRLARK